MRTLLIAFIIVLLIIIVWFLIVNHMDASLHGLITIIDEDITEDILADNWSEGLDHFSEFTSLWQKHQSLYNLFIDQSAVMQVNYAIARIQAYMDTKSKALTLGELYFIKEHLNALHEDELISIENVF